MGVRHAGVDERLVLAHAHALQEAHGVGVEEGAAEDEVPHLAAEEAQAGVLADGDGSRGRQGLQHGGLTASLHVGLELVDVAHVATHLAVEGGEHVGVGELVVGVNEEDELRLRPVDAGIAGAAHAAVGLVEGADAGVLPREVIAQRAATVGRTVVHKDQLKIGECLGENAAYAALQIALRPVDRNNDGKDGNGRPGRCWLWLPILF